jgi:2,3-bisphosphoglycerate-independent phosphoglycerate mutase
MDAELARLGVGRVASLVGRYFAMDRDQRWDRVERAWKLLVDGEAPFRAETAVAGLEAAYAREENDEFVQPTAIHGAGEAPARIADGDVVIFMNFRADRARQLARAFVDDAFDGFARPHRPQLARFVTLTRYADDLDAPCAYAPTALDNTLGEYVAGLGRTQLRIAETEKYAHVTYFFNGGEEQVFEGEDRKLVASPRVATYDLQPEMSAPELTRELVHAIGTGAWPVIVCNVANPDMVGHSGDFDAAVKAVEAVDALLGQAMEAVAAAGGEMLVTADHGNCEQMTDPETGQPHTAHTLNPVPLVFFGRPATLEPEGSLRDIAPTMLELLGLPVPDEMTGRPLVRLESGADRAGPAATAGHAAG